MATVAGLVWRQRDGLGGSWGPCGRGCVGAEVASQSLPPPSQPMRTPLACFRGSLGPVEAEPALLGDGDGDR